MRRQIVVIATVLVMGAIVNVAVAWGLLAAAPVRNYSSDRDLTVWYEFAERHNLQPSDTRVPFRLWSESRYDGTGFSVTRVDYTPMFLGGTPIFGTGTFLVYTETGSPVRCLHGWVFEHREYCHCIRVDPNRFRAGALIFTSRADVCIPLRPIWSGLVVNTMLFAALLWMGLVGPFAIRRALRRKRWLCQRCAYPIGVSPVCTECGAAVLRMEGA